MMLWWWLSTVGQRHGLLLHYACIGPVACQLHTLICFCIVSIQLPILRPPSHPQFNQRRPQVLVVLRHPVLRTLSQWNHDKHYIKDRFPQFQTIVELYKYCAT